MQWLESWKRWNLVAGGCFCALLMLGCQEAGDGLTKFPVTGLVRVNGQPAARVVVNLQHTDTSLPGRNARFPVGITDEEGIFELSTNGLKDGAVPGEYRVTFQWLGGSDADPFDRFNGLFSDPARSEFRRTVEESSTTLEAFDITIPESKILPSKPSKNRTS